MTTPTSTSASQHAGRPAAEVEITPDTVRSLLQRQHPALADQPVSPADAGWDNAVFRLGERFAVRLPRRAAAETLILNEQRWLPLLAARLPLPIPSPLHIGKPSGDYPWHWSVVPWLAGMPASLSEPNAEQGERLAEFFNALHVPAPPDAPVNSFRGVELASRASALEERLRRVQAKAGALDTKIAELWTCALKTPMDSAPTWVHGDLHGQNVLVSAGRLSGIIDWGDLCRGDRATDLAATWMLLPDRGTRQRAMDACRGVTEATWARARGWAIFFAVVLSDSGLAGDGQHARMGRKILRHLMEGP